MTLKNTKGFTLIELMAVLGVLTIIAIIAVPAINNILKNAEDGSVESSMAMVERAAAVAFVADNKPDIQGYTVKHLVDDGYLDYDYSEPDALDGTAVHAGSGVFHYANPNLVTNSNFKNGLTGNGWSNVYGSHTASIGNYVKTFTSSAGANRVEYYAQESLEPGTYTLSFKGQTPMDPRWSYEEDATVINSSSTWKSPSEVAMFSVTFTVEDKARPRLRGYMANLPVGSKVKMEWYKLEKGPLATPWVP